MPARIAVVYYSLYGHVTTLAKEIVTGVEAAGATATLLQVPETLSSTVLEKMKAPPRDTTILDVSAEDLLEYDGILFGVPTRFGMAASQMKAFLDSTGGIWAKGGLAKKTAGVFFSTGTQGGGQETTALTFLTQFTHHGMIYVPMGYSNPKLGDMTEIHGGSPYGPGTFAGDGSRQVTDLEKDLARSYGEHFGNITNTFVKGASM